MAKVKLRAPATTANIGPGFDSLGCAFKLYNYYTFEDIPSGLEIEGCDEEFQNEKNLSYVAFKACADYLSRQVKGVRICIDETNIPVSRGLGSSAAMIAAGIVAANTLYDGKLKPRELLKIANEVEGHPDNVAPALFGGFTASFLDGCEPYTVKYSISPKLKFCAIFPDFQVSTHMARGVLPKEIPFDHAIHNISRVSVLFKALEDCDEELIRLCLNDKLHQPYRKALIHEFEKVKEIAQDHCNCCGFFISGAGPTLMCISTSKDIETELKPHLKKLEHKWTLIPLESDQMGTVIIE